LIPQVSRVSTSICWALIRTFFPRVSGLEVKQEAGLSYKIL
jgi:hypothetical protein